MKSQASLEYNAAGKVKGGTSYNIYCCFSLPFTFGACIELFGTGPDSFGIEGCLTLKNRRPSRAFFSGIDRGSIADNR